jgi:hypothetical protein
LKISGLILENVFMVFWGSSCRETAKNAIKQIDGKRRQETSFFSQLFRPKAFDILTWTFPKKFLMVFLNFELPLLRNAQKRHKQNLQKNKKRRGTYLPHLEPSGHLPDVRRFQKEIIWRPLYRGGAGKGPAKKNVGDPLEKGQGSDLFFRYFFIVFLNSPHRETLKNVIKKIEKKSVLDFWSNFL